MSNKVSFLRTSREFPEDLRQLTVEVNKSYVDTANAVNVRTIGIFTSNAPSATGESWVIFQNKRQQTLRRAYTFTSTSNVPHGISFPQFDGFTRMYGEYTDGTNWYGLVAGTSVAVAGQTLFYCTPTDIVFVVGAGAPALTKGRIVLEWLAETQN